MSERIAGYKDGANYSDQRRIKAMNEAGHSVEDISRALRVQPSVVENFLPQEEKPKRKRRTKAEMAEAAAQEAEE